MFPFRMALAVVALVVLCGCGTQTGASQAERVKLRLGYFPNLTHAGALIGIENGYFTSALAGSATLEAHTFNAGGDAVTAILSGAIDATFAGPNPTTNAFVQSHGQAIRVVSGATSGGAMLVVKTSISSIDQLRGKRIADPQLGGTQDVALRWFLKSHGLKTDTSGGGDVSILPEDNSQILTAFKQGQIDGAWLPEPWSTRLIVEAGGKILIDERDLWPGGSFVTTNLIVATTFLRAHPAQVKDLLEGLYAATAFITANPGQAQGIANDAVAKITGKKLADMVVSTAWPHMTFMLDPLAVTLKASADHAHSVGLLSNVSLSGLYDLSLLNQVLSEHGQPPVSGL